MFCLLVSFLKQTLFLGWCTNKSYVIATSDLWLFIHASNLLPLNSPSPLPYKSWRLRAGLEVEESLTRKQCRGAVWRPFNGSDHQQHGRATAVASDPTTKATTIHWRGGWLQRRWIYSGGGAHPPELQDGGRNSSGVVDPGFGGICPEGGAHPCSRGGRHSGQSFDSPHSNLCALLTSFHGRRQGMGESVVGYAQHLLMLTTKLNAAQADVINPAMLCDRFIDGLHPPSLRRDIRCYAREHDDVTFHQARAEAQRWMREDADVEVRAEQVLVAQPQHSKELEELLAQVAALTAKTGWAATPVNPGTTA